MCSCTTTIGELQSSPAGGTPLEPLSVSDSDKVVSRAFTSPALIQKMTVGFLMWSKAADKCCRTVLPMPPPKPCLHLIIVEYIVISLSLKRGKIPPVWVGTVSCHQTALKTVEAHSRLIMLSERYQTHPICLTPSTHMSSCLSHATHNIDVYMPIHRHIFSSFWVKLSSLLFKRVCSALILQHVTQFISKPEHNTHWPAGNWLQSLFTGCFWQRMQEETVTDRKKRHDKIWCNHIPPLQNKCVHFKYTYPFMAKCLKICCTQGYSKYITVCDNSNDENKCEVPLIFTCVMPNC